MQKLFRRHPDYPDDLILEIDNSSLEYFNSCARSAEYQLVHKRGFDGSSATMYGGAIHNFLERNVRGVSFEDNVRAMQEEFALMPPKDVDDWRTFDHALTAMQMYRTMYAQRDDFGVAFDGKNQPLVEVPFRLPLTTIDLDATIPYTAELIVVDDPTPKPVKVKRVHIYWTGKIDLLGWHGADMPVPAVMDHKTTSMLGPTFFKDFELSQQVVGYVWATRQLVEPLGLPREFAGTLTFILDVIAGRKPSRTGVQNEFVRQKYVYTEAMLLEWQVNVSHLTADFLAHLLRGYFPMQTKWCVGKYGMCPFHDVCVLPANLRLQHLYAAYAPVKWSPLNAAQ
jgi:hypothetical protein